VQLLSGHAVEPVLFLPVFGQKGSIPVKVTAMDVEDGAMTLTVAPLDRFERDRLLEHIRSPHPTPARGAR
jgi:hypothetical protein